MAKRRKQGKTQASVAKFEDQRFQLTGASLFEEKPKK
jgi:hypothetical protein